MTNHDQISSLAELRATFPELQSVNVVHRKRLSFLNKLAMTVTGMVGSMKFFLVIMTWTVLWLTWNIFAPAPLRFDPFPAFVLWLFLSNMIQLHLMPLFMVGQNLQSAHAELRAEHDYQINRKSEKEIEAVLMHMERQQELMLEILHRVEKLEDRK